MGWNGGFGTGAPSSRPMPVSCGASPPTSKPVVCASTRRVYVPCAVPSLATTTKYVWPAWATKPAHPSFATPRLSVPLFAPCATMVVWSAA